jgi:hypothetical protein
LIQSELFLLLLGVPVRPMLDGLLVAQSLHLHIFKTLKNLNPLGAIVRGRLEAAQICRGLELGGKSAILNMRRGCYGLCVSIETKQNGNEYCFACLSIV